MRGSFREAKRIMHRLAKLRRGRKIPNERGPRSESDREGQGTGMAPFRTAGWPGRRLTSRGNTRGKGAKRAAFLFLRAARPHSGRQHWMIKGGGAVDGLQPREKGPLPKKQVSSGVKEGKKTKKEKNEGRKTVLIVVLRHSSGKKAKHRNNQILSHTLH